MTNIGAFFSYDRTDLISQRIDYALLLNIGKAKPIFATSAKKEDLQQNLKQIPGKVLTYGGNLYNSNIFIDIKKRCSEFSDEWDPDLNLYQSVILLTENYPAFSRLENCTYIESKLFYECLLLKHLYEELC